MTPIAALKGDHMRAIKVSHTSEPDVLEPVDIPEPELAQGSLLVEVSAAGLNFITRPYRTQLDERGRPADRPVEDSRIMASATNVAAVPGCMPENVITVGERMRAAVATLAIAHEGLPYRKTVSVSVGATAAHGATAAFGVTPVTLLAAADEAPYVAKRGGRDRVSCKANVLHVVPKDGG